MADAVSGQGPFRREPAFELVAVGTASAPGVPLRSIRKAQRHVELDAHCAIAVLGTVIFHVYQYCNVGHLRSFGTPVYPVAESLDAMVTWLFVIAAFLLSRPIVGSIIDDPDPPVLVRPLLLRRAVGLLPAYFFAVSVVWFARQRSLPGDWRDLLEHLTFTQVFDEKRIFYTIGPAWAISVIVLLGIGTVLVGAGIARVARRTPSRDRRIVLLAVVVAAAASVSVAAKAYAFASGRRPATDGFTVWFGPIGNLDAFAAGLAVAVTVVARGDTRALKARTRLALRLAALAILAVAVATRRADVWSGVCFATVCAIAFACLVAAAVLGPAEDRWWRWPPRAPVLAVATISYSVYLWHEPLMLALSDTFGVVRQSPGAFPADTGVVLACSLVAGWLGHHLIERPARLLEPLLVSRRAPDDAAHTRKERLT